MALRKIGEATTNSDGIATLTYTGTGVGEVDLKACYYEEDTGRIIQSETCSTLDCILYDTMETNKYFSYYKNNNAANIEYSSEYAKTGNQSLKWNFIGGGLSNTNYFGIRATSNPTSSQLPISSFKGNRIRFELDTNASVAHTGQDGFYIAFYVQTETNPSWTTLTTQAIGIGENSYELNADVPLNATELWIRLNIVGGSIDKVLYIDNWRLYPI